jgi:hypothetical protein
MHEATKGRGPGQWWPCTNGIPITLYCPNCGKPHGITPPPDVGQFECTVCGHRGDIKLVEAPAAPAAWRDHVEQRIREWRHRTMNRSGDRLAIDDYMDQAAIDDLVDYVCDEWTGPPSNQPAQRVGELPPLPTKRRGAFCTKCYTSFTPTVSDEFPPCVKCGYLAFAQDCDYGDEEMQAYARAAQAPAAEPLTDEQIDELVTQHAGYGRDDFQAVARAVERAHGIKETT